MIPAFDGDKRKSRTPIEQKGMQPKVAKESGRSSSHKASKNLEEMDIERAEAKKRLEFTPTEDKETKKQKQESADEDERREKTVHCQDRQASDEESERSKSKSSNTGTAIETCQIALATHKQCQE